MTVSTPSEAAQPLSRSALVFSLICAFAFLYLRTFLLPATPFAGIGDQLLFFSRAARIVHGEILYRDVFELVTPGTELFYAMLLRLFGMHAWLVQACTIAFGMAGAVLITLIAGKISHGPVVLLPALLFLAFDFNNAIDLTHHWYSTLFALAAVAMLMKGSAISRIFAAGSLCAIATLFTQTQGTFTLFALIAYLVWLNHSEAGVPSIWRRLAALILPFCVILSSVLGYYMIQAGFRTVFFDLVLFAPQFLTSPRPYLGEFPPMLHSPSGIVRIIPSLFIFAINPYIYLLGFYQLWRSGNKIPFVLRRQLVLLHLVGIGLFLAVAISGPTLFRLGTAAPPAILILTWLLSRPSPTLRLARILLCSLAIVLSISTIVYNQTRWHGILDLPTGRVAFTDPVVYREYRWLAQRTRPSDLFFNDSGVTLYLSLDNPTPSEFITYNDFSRPELVSAIVESLRRNPPHYIIAMPANTAPSDGHDHAAPFRQYVRDNYRLVQIFTFRAAVPYEEQLWELNAKTESPR